MRMKLLVPAVVLLILLAVSQLIMNNDDRENTGSDPDDSPAVERQYKTIAIVAQDMRHMFMANVAGMIREKAKDNENIKVLLYDSQGSSQKQISQLKELIEKKVDGIILNPAEKDTINPAIEEVKRAGIPLITVNMNASSQAVDCHIGSDSVQAGEFQGNFVADQLKGQGNLAVLAGTEGQNTTEDRLQGLNNVIGKYPGMHIAAIEHGNWERARGAEMMEKILSRNQKIDAVISQNDEMLLGALQVLDRHGLKPVTIGIDAIPEALEALKEGRISATVHQNSKAQAAGAFEIMSRIFNHEKVETIKWIPQQLVTPQNIDDYLAPNMNGK